jgi:hypothetical protein
MEAGAPGAGRLQERLSGVVAEIAAIRRDLEAVISTPVPSTSGAESGAELEGDELLVAIVRNVIKARELRSHNLREGLFADPAWDMLLDLFLARLLGRRICVSSLCIASRVPATTALRWIKDMERHGEVIRHADRTDKRRAYIEISDEAFQAVCATLLGAELVPSR